MLKKLSIRRRQQKNILKKKQDSKNDTIREEMRRNGK